MEYSSSIEQLPATKVASALRSEPPGRIHGVAFRDAQENRYAVSTAHANRNVADTLDAWSSALAALSSERSVT